MRLDFTVLLVDDQPGGVKGALDRLEQHVADEGFRLKVVQAANMDAAAALIQDDVLTDGIDLVLVDYDLGSGARGDYVLTRIRQAMPYKEVVFYSAAATADLRKLAYEAGVEGIYCANRTSLGDTVTGVFDALVKKVLDVDHCRGIILGATSDIDDLVNEIIRTVDKQLTDEQRTASFAFALQRIDDTLQRFQDIRDRLSAESTLEALLAAHQLFTSVDRLRLLIELHDHRFQKSQPGIRKAIGRYVERIPGVRNLFGHARLKPGEPQKALERYSGQSVDLATLREVRKELIEFGDQFQELAELVGCNLPNTTT